MPIAPVAQPLFASVPASAGVPALLRSPLLRTLAAIEDKVILLAADAVLLLRLFEGPRWGLFDDAHRPLFTELAQVAVRGVDFRKAYRLPDFPIEDGGFATYDKVETPSEPVVTYAVGGSEGQRRAFLDALDKAARSLALVQLVTPEISYPRMNIARYDYRRSDSAAATLITVEVWLQEVRSVAVGTFSNTRDAAAAPVAEGGSVAATPATPAQAAARAAGGGGGAGPLPLPPVPPVGVPNTPFIGPGTA